MIKPEEIVKWALQDAQETRLGGNNKIKPSGNLIQNGTLDGSFSLNHINWLLNKLGLWTEFNNDFIQVSDGQGVKITKDDHMSLVVAADKTDISKYIMFLAFKDGSNAPSTNVINSNVLSIDGTNSEGDVSIAGSLSTDIITFSFNLKNN